MPWCWVSGPSIPSLKKMWKLRKRKERKETVRLTSAHLSIAYAELYLTIARIVRTFNMDLYETTLEDVEIHHARIMGYPRKAKGQGNERGKVKVKVTGKTEEDTGHGC